MANNPYADTPKTMKNNTFTNDSFNDNNVKERTKRTKPIRDPIYDYIPITVIEQTIIDKPVFQRLRFIFQNASAYLTYPSNSHSRFLHSLGVMHNAGNIFSKALENTLVKS